jgi:hypothetical protein
MDLSIDPVLGLASRFLATLVFGAAALHKVRAPREFATVLRNYRLLPDGLVEATTVLVICVETFAALGIWWADMRREAAACAMALLVVYSLAILANLSRGRREIDCGCSFGGSGQPLSPALLARNALLVIPCVVAGLPLSGGIHWLGVVMASFGAVSFVLCYQAWGVMLTNRPRVLRLVDR